MNRICVIDSGVGGVCVLNECVKILPNVDFLYIADNKNSPFGNKSKKDIDLIFEKIIFKINKETGIIFFVLACNTATATSIKHLRNTFPNFIFIGIEPAIKPCACDNKKTLVLSTFGTYKYSSLVAKYLDNKNMIFAPQKDLAKLIDNNLDNLWNIYDFLYKTLKQYKKETIKNIVLGCTHYFFIKEQLNKIFPDVVFFESSKGVAKRLKTLLEHNPQINYELISKKDSNNHFFKNKNTKIIKNSDKIIFLTTKKDAIFKNKLLQVYNHLL